MDFHSLMDIMNKEIVLYADMRELFAAKKLIIIQNEVNKLSEIDSRIIEHVKRNEKVNEERIKLTGGTHLNITTLINLARKKAPQYICNLERYKEQFSTLSKEISELYKENLELLEYGISLTDKSVNIIIGVLSPKKTNYSKHGKESVSNVVLSTIVRVV